MHSKRDEPFPKPDFGFLRQKRSRTGVRAIYLNVQSFGFMVFLEQVHI
jgi:hypothetical protein